MSRCLWIAVLLVGCATAPLGDDFGSLSAAEQDARALAALEELFQGAGSGGALNAREVQAVDLEGIRYRHAAGDSHLRWQDVDSVLAQTVEELPGRPETIRVYVRQQSPSDQAVSDLEDPLLAKTGFVQRYLVLRQRPRFSRLRLIAALDHVRYRREQRLVSALAGTAAVATPTHTAPPPEDPERLNALEAKLRELKEWHEAGLITSEEYDLKRRELLEGL